MPSPCLDRLDALGSGGARGFGYFLLVNSVVEDLMRKQFCNSMARCTFAKSVARSFRQIIPADPVASESMDLLELGCRKAPSRGTSRQDPRTA